MQLWHPNSTTRAVSTVFVEERRLIAQAESCAADALQRCVQHEGSSRSLKSLVLPLQVERWIETVYGISLEFAELRRGEGDSMILGTASVDPGRIHINEALVDDEARCRFVAAHELGHILMHAEILRDWTRCNPMPRNDHRASHGVEQANVADPFDNGTDTGIADRYDPDIYAASGNRHPLERQADRFAAALLMPPALLVREFFAVCVSHRLDTQRTITELLSASEMSVTLWRELFVPELARRFGVTASAVLYRLCDLRLFDHAPLMLVGTMVKLLKGERKSTEREGNRVPRHRDTEHRK